MVSLQPGMTIRLFVSKQMIIWLLFVPSYGHRYLCEVVIPNSVNSDLKVISLFLENNENSDLPMDCTTCS